MMCVIEISGGEICKWAVGTDIYDLRRQALAQNSDDQVLAEGLNRIEFPPPGLTQINERIYLIVQ